jgi:hypothetical protein
MSNYENDILTQEKESLYVKEMDINKFIYQLSDIEFKTEEASLNLKEKIITRYLICIVTKETNLLLYTTDYTKYIYYSDGKKRSLHNPEKDEVLYITNLLNWILLKNNDFYNIDRIEDITFDMCQDYLNDYAVYGLTDREESPTFASINSVRSHITRFMVGMKNHGVNHNLENHWIKKLNPKASRRFTGYSYELDIIYDKTKRILKILRDIPTVAIELILTCARIYMPLMELPTAIQVYSLIREGEVCNCRRRNSIYGAGIVTENLNEEITGITIKLRTQFKIRSDNVPVGNIKSNEDAYLYTGVIPAFIEVYNRHLELTKNYKIEDTQPLFVNQRVNRKNGCHMAMSVASYRANFKTLMNKYAIPIMRSSENSVLRDFAQILDRNRYGLHWFRHYGTVQLVLAGVSWHDLMTFRRDSNPDSAIVYVTNKDIFRKMYSKANAKFSEDIMKYSFIADELDRLEEDDMDPIN